jgi:hypothetical protein
LILLSSAQSTCPLEAPGGRADAKFGDGSFFASGGDGSNNGGEAVVVAILAEDALLRSSLC